MADVANVGKVGQVSTGDTIVYQASNKCLVFSLNDSEGIRTLPTLTYRSSGSGTTSGGSATVTYSAASAGLENFDAKTLDEAVFSNSISGILTPTSKTLTGSGNPYSFQVVFPEAPGPHSFNLTGIVSQGSPSLGLKTKSLVTGNVVSTVIGAAENLATLRTDGRVLFNPPNKTPGRKDNLGVSDVIRIRKVVDTLQSGVGPNTFHLSDSTYDITSRYMLDTGQRDSLYDHASITLRPGAVPPVGQIAVIFDYYSHGGSSNGYFSVQSYDTVNNSYTGIGSYTRDDGGVMQLRDSLDFRPRRTDLLATAKVDSSSRTDTFYLPITGKNSPADQSIASYSGTKYLPRRDNLVIAYDGTLRVIEGVAHETPLPPSDDPDSLILYTISYPSYVFSPRDVELVPHNNRRFTMKDIGEMKSRLDRLQYYVALNQLETETNAKTILNNDGTIERFKNGILTDNFDSLQVADTLSGDYRAGVDTIVGILRPATRKKSFNLIFSGAALYEQRTGIPAEKFSDLVLPEFEEVGFITQAMASEAVSVVDVDETVYRGFITLSPSSDIFIDTQVMGTEPSVTTTDDLSTYVDTTTVDDETLAGPDLLDSAYIYNNYEVPSHFQGPGNADQFFGLEPTIMLNLGGTTSRVNQNGIKSGYRTWRNVPHEVPLSEFLGFLRSAPASPQASSGHVVDTSVIPYIREQGISILASGMKSNTVLLFVL